MQDRRKNFDDAVKIAKDAVASVTTLAPWYDGIKTNDIAVFDKRAQELLNKLDCKAFEAQTVDVSRRLEEYEATLKTEGSAGTDANCEAAKRASWTAPPWRPSSC